MSAKWSSEQIPDQRGRTAIVTGANSGLGLATARGAGASRRERGARLPQHRQGRARRGTRDRGGRARGSAVELAARRLGSSESVQSFAEHLRSWAATASTLLINNAGVMAPPRRQTEDGFELQFGTNHLGHFALTGRLIGAMEGREDARVVTPESNAHRTGRIDVREPQAARATT